jgi:NAD(P)-dependent dehydrogenase (short-subunit alcohol dehydrogenase family)
MAKHVVITGVTRGLGLALAQKFIELGHHVSGCGRSRTAIDALRRAHDETHDFAVVDVADEIQVRAWAARLLAHRDAPDLLINNAGVINRKAPVWELSAREIDDVVDVNVKGVLHVIRHFVPAMIARKSGVIVNISSGWGRSAAPDFTPYCASKWAIEGLTRSLAKELPPELAAIALNPGTIDTEMLRTIFGEGAGSHATARTWSEKAVAYILPLGPRDSGRPLTVPA